MPATPALVIIHNHRFDGNIPVLEALYGERFSRIMHLVPFHPGDRSGVIPVHGHSHQFQGYVAQGLHAFHNEQDQHPHYIFIADDLLLAPQIDETNYRTHFELDKDTGFLPNFIDLHRWPTWWRRIAEAVDYDPQQPGVEAVRELPTVAEAKKRFSLHGLELGPIPHRAVGGPLPKGGIAALRWLKQHVLAPRGGHELRYPLVGSYSDLFIVPGKDMKHFAHLCGVFAATRLFVELAIPTAMALAVDRIRTERDTRLKGRALWNAEDLRILEPYGHDLDALLRDFPAGSLYLHPVKLTRWQRSAR